jgi:hypothetical protein
MTQEITALGNEITERNQTIREKVTELFLFIYLKFSFSLIVLVILN